MVYSIKGFWEIIDSRLAFLAWGDFHTRSRFARSTIPEENGDYSESREIKENPARKLAIFYYQLTVSYLQLEELHAL